MGNGRAYLPGYGRLFRPTPSGGATLWRIVGFQPSLTPPFWRGADLGKTFLSLNTPLFIASPTMLSTRLVGSSMMAVRPSERLQILTLCLALVGFFTLRVLAGVEGLAKAETNEQAGHNDRAKDPAGHGGDVTPWHHRDQRVR